MLLLSLSREWEELEKTMRRILVDAFVGVHKEPLGGESNCDPDGSRRLLGVLI
jgi:hypothetical protein